MPKYTKKGKNFKIRSKQIEKIRTKEKDYFDKKKRSRK